MMRRSSFLAAAVLAAGLMTPAAGSAGTRGADELFWIPTFEQARAIARHTGRPIFLVAYTCVDSSTATYSGRATAY